MVRKFLDLSLNKWSKKRIDKARFYTDIGSEFLGNNIGNKEIKLAVNLKYIRPAV